MSTLRFRLEATPAADGAVSARDFTQFLVAVLNCFRHLEDETGHQAPVDYRIVDLGAGSAAVELEATSAGDLGRSAALVTERFEVGFRALEDGAIGRAPFGRRTKSAFIRLMKPLGSDTQEIQLIAQETHRLSRRTPRPEVVQTEVDAISVGSVAGNVDALNVHGRAVFYLYPASGPTRIPCRFEPSLLDDLRATIKRHTTVFGLLEYEPGNPFPVRVVVERVEVNQSDDELPALSDLYGSLPELAGGMESSEFIRRSRDVSA